VAVGGTNTPASWHSTLRRQIKVHRPLARNFLEVPRIVEHEMIIASRAINRADLPTLMVLTELEG